MFADEEAVYEYGLLGKTKAHCYREVLELPERLEMYRFRLRCRNQMEANRQRPHDSDKAGYLFPAQKKRAHFQLPLLGEPIQGTDSKTDVARPFATGIAWRHAVTGTHCEHTRQFTVT